MHCYKVQLQLNMSLEIQIDQFENFPQIKKKRRFHYLEKNMGCPIFILYQVQFNFLM